MIFLLNILLALAWMALNGDISWENFIVGYLLGFLFVWIAERATSSPSYSSKVWQVISFILFFLWELLVANLRVAYEVLTPADRMHPGVIAIPLDIKRPAEITLLANLITLTPGTLSIDVSTDQRTLYVHTMYVYDVEAFRRNIKDGFEKRVHEVFQ